MVYGIPGGLVYAAKGIGGTVGSVLGDFGETLVALAPGGMTVEETAAYQRNMQAVRDKLDEYLYADTEEEKRAAAERFNERMATEYPFVAGLLSSISQGVGQALSAPVAVVAAGADWVGADGVAEDTREAWRGVFGDAIDQWQYEPVDTAVNAISTAAMGVGAAGRALGSGRMAQAAVTAEKAGARAAATANRASRSAARLSGAAEAAAEAGNAARAAKLAGKAQKVAAGGKTRAAKILAEGEAAAKYLDAAKSTRRGQWAWKLRHISGQMNRYDPTNMSIELGLRRLGKLLTAYGAKRVAAGKGAVPGATQVAAVLGRIGNSIEAKRVEADAVGDLARFGEVEASYLRKAIDDYSRIMAKSGNRDLDAAASLIAYGHLDAMRAAMPDFERVFSHPDSLEPFGPELENRLRNWVGKNAVPEMGEHQVPKLEHLKLAVDYVNGTLDADKRAVIDMSLEGRRVLESVSNIARRTGRGMLRAELLDDFAAGKLLEGIGQQMADPVSALREQAWEHVFDNIGSDIPAESMLFDLADSNIPAQYKPALRGAARDIAMMRRELAEANGGKITPEMELAWQEGAASVVQALADADEVVFAHGGVASSSWLDNLRLEDTGSLLGTDGHGKSLADRAKTAALTPLTFDQAVELALRAAHRRAVHQAIARTVRRVGLIVPDGRKLDFDPASTGMVKLDFVENAGGEMWVPKHLYRPLKRVFDAPPPSGWEKAGRLYDKGIGPWKTIVLATSGMWQQANVVTNAILLNVSGGIRISEIIGSLGDAYRLRKHVQANPFEDPQLTATLSGGFTGSVRRERLARSGARPQRTAFRAPVLRSVFGDERRTLTGHAFALNEFSDSMARSVVYIDSMKKGALPDEALKRAQQSIGDYDRLTVEGRWMVRGKPFWRWVRTITKLALKLPFEHPFRAAWLLSLHSRFADEEPEGVPDYYRGNYFDPERGLMWNTGQMIPGFEGAFDLRNLVLGGNSPVIDIGYRHLTGGKTLTGDFEARFPRGEDISGNRLGMLREDLANLTFWTRLANNPTGEKRYADGTAIPGQYTEYGGWAEDLPYAVSAIAQQLGLRPPRDIGVDTIRRWEADARREREKRRRAARAKTRLER